jgi:DNA adenine methylase
LFYLDPPYHGGESDYGKGMFGRGDFEKMAEQLSSIKGNFILSINDVPDIREVFSGFHIDEVRLNYSISQGTGKRVGELIISNCEARAGLL